ncbi:MAG TPA: alpha/beta fold hydrolase [Gaiellaceae bacterium]|nr:alpha/beta fold hydrolase [Gaiellaceae bacterium]
MTELAAPVGTPPRLIPVEELFADPLFSNARISPDGTRIAYVAPAHGRRNVWVRGIDEEHGDAVCVTHDAHRGVFAFQWTDDPRWLLYMQDTDGNEDWHLYRVDLEAPDAPPVDLTPLDPGSRVLGFEPLRSQPGTLLVTMNKRPLYIDAFRVDVATGETTLHRECPDLTGGFLFGHDGETFYHLVTEDGGWEFSVLDEAGEKRVFHRVGGAAYPLGPVPMQVAPDGKGLLLGVFPEGSDDLQLVRVDAETGEQTVVAALPGRSLDGPFPHSALFTRERTGEVLAARFVGDPPEVLLLDEAFAEIYPELTALSDGVLAGVSSDDEERRWVATFAHDREPGLSYLYDRETGESRLLFRPYPHLDPAELAPMTPVSFPARDGLPLHGYLTLPLGVEPRNLPLVLNVHGGPWMRDEWGWDREVQFLANRGYAVLQVNFRGSAGYGKRHITGAVGEFAGTMHDDLIDACAWAVEQGYADPKRLGVYGGSYGGYATLVAVTFTPDVFAAAVDYCGISDLANFMRTMPPFVRARMAANWYAYVGDPADPAQEADMLARSPIGKVDEIRTPLLVVQGANDVRVVKEEADNIVESLRSRGVPVEYLVADDEGHGFLKVENLIAMFRAIERHFGEHLGGRTS